MRNRMRAAAIVLLPLTASASEENLLDLSLAQLMQIKITSEKRELPWDQIPQTVDVYTGTQLRSQQVNDFRDLAEIAPGYSYGRVGNIASSYVRGIGSDLISIAADASTAVYLDDVYLARPEMTAAQFWDVDHIEILKGPQGALYGRNATGGAIKIIANHANFEPLSGYAQLDTGSFNGRKLEAAVGGELSDALAARASVLAIKDTGFTQDIDPQGTNNIDDNNVKASRLELRWRLNERLESRLSGDYYQNNNDGYSIRPNDDLGIAEQKGALDTPNFHQTRNNIASYSHYQTEGVNWRWNWNSDYWTLESISAYRNISADYRLNTDGTEVPVVESKFVTLQNQHSHELRLTSTGNGDLQWLLGASWLKEMPRLDVDLIRHPINTSIVILADARTVAWGAYGELSWKFQPRWDMKLRLRNSVETRDDRNRIFSTGDLKGLDSPAVDTPRAPSSIRNSSFHKLSPQLMLSYSPAADDRQLWYLNATEGFKSGGANSLSTSPSFKPEEITSFEAGFKSTAPARQWSLSLFHYDYQNLQVVTFEQGVTAITNAASAKVNGIDISGLFQLSESLQYQAGISYLSAQYDHFITAYKGAAKDVSGNTMPYAPSLDLNQKISYNHKLNTGGQLTVQLLHHFQSKTYFSQFEDNAVAQTSRHTFDLLGDWAISPEWSLSAGVFNLTDTEYFQNIVRFTTTSIASAPQGNALGYTAPGRHWMLGSTWRF